MQITSILQNNRNKDNLEAFEVVKAVIMKRSLMELHGSLKAVKEMLQTRKKDGNPQYPHSIFRPGTYFYKHEKD